MLDERTLPLLKAGKNLLAFSAGVDSTALFFLLREAGIAFDIAFVNYHTREQSDAEETYARELAARYDLQCHCHDAAKITRNFEAQARTVRYRFFERVIGQYRYDNLLTAHQLDDRFEWLLMQFSKGAGLPELLGMHAIEKRQEYTLLRPLLLHSKSELREWLDAQGRHYFEDASNLDPKYRRNHIRKTFSSPFLQEYLQGIRQTFAFLERDASALKSGEATIIVDDEILMLATPQTRLELMRILDRWLKRQGYLLKQGEKERILHEDDLVLGRRFALGVRRYTLLTPYVQDAMPKTFKETCRRLDIGTKVRPYLSINPAVFSVVRAVLEESKA